MIGAVDLFERLRHPSKSDSESPADRAAYQDALSIIENAITSRILGFFAVKDRLQDVVDAANVQTEDGVWTQPAEVDVSATLARIGGLQHRRIFYDQLGNPEWIGPLDRLAALEPPKALDPDAEQRWQPWPAGDYLVRMAEHRPAEVRQILLRVIDDETAWPAKVRLLEAALRMPVADARAMASAIQLHLNGELDPNLALDVVTFIEQLAQAGEMRPAMRLAQIVLRPRTSPNAGGRGPPRRARRDRFVLVCAGPEARDVCPQSRPAPARHCVRMAALRNNSSAILGTRTGTGMRAASGDRRSATTNRTIATTTSQTRWLMP